MTEPRQTTESYDPDRPADQSFELNLTQDSAMEGTAPDSKAPRRPVPDLHFLAPALKPGELGRLGGYRVLEVLGEGGMGLVFRAEDPHLQRPVAIKVVRPELAANAHSAERFLREARAAAKIKHDHVVTIYQVGQDRGVPFLALEFLRGESLDARLKQAGRLPAFEVLRIGHEAALGLAAAHEQGLIHRDIKPANVWLESPNARVKLLDFGLARAANEDVHLTGSGAVVGTPAYMSPEQANGQSLDHRTDLFSLGVMLYRLVTGHMPFPGDSSMAILAAMAFTEPTPPRQFVPEVPPLLNDAILKLLAKKPANRIQTAHEVAELFASAATSVTVVPLPAADAEYNREFDFDDGPTVVDAPPEPHREPPKKRAPWALLAACGFGALLTLLGGGWIIIKVTKPDGTVEEVKVPPGSKVEILPGAGGKTAPTAKAVAKSGETLPTLPVKLPAGPSPLDKLDAAKIPEAERPEYLPKETVAVIGSHERRSWGMSPFGLSGGLGYSPDGKYLATVDFHNLYVFDAATMKLVHRQGGQTFADTHRPFAFSPDSRTLYHVRHLVTWDLTRGGVKQVVDPALNKLFGFSIAASPDGKWLAYTANAGGECGVVDLTAAGSPTAFTWKTTGLGREVAFSPDSNWLIAGDIQLGYRVIRRADGKWAETTPIKKGAGLGMFRAAYSFTAKRKHAYALAGTSLVPVDLSGAEPRELEVVPGLDAIVDFAIDATGEKWAATRHDYGKTGAAELILGDWTDDALRETKRVPLPHVGYVAFAPDGKSIATHGHDRAVHIWDITGETPVRKHQGDHPQTDHVSLSPDGALAASVCYDGQLTLWDLADGQYRRKQTVKAKHTLSGSGWLNATTLVTYSHPGLHIPNGPIQFTLWDATPEGLKERTAYTATHTGWKFATLQDGTRMMDANVLWDLTATPPKQLATFTELSKTPLALDLSPDGKWIAAAVSGKVQLFDVSKPADPPVATGPDAGGVTSLKFAPDGASFLTVASGGLAQRWERKGADLVSTMKYTSGSYHTTNAAFSPDGNRVYFAGHGALTEFDAKLGTVVRTWSLPGWCHVVALADGRYVMTQNGNGTSYVIRLGEAAKPAERTKK